MTKKERLEAIIAYYSKGKPSVFARFLGVAPSTISSWLARDTFDSELLFAKCESINPDWLLTGEGSMLKTDVLTHTATPANTPATPADTTLSELRDNYETTRRLIPFYDDVFSQGGYGSYVEDTNTPALQPTDWIVAGDWFHDATAAIRQHGDSMTEYPSGSILAIKLVNDHRLIIPGCNYVIETTEFRVTKQIQPRKDHFMAYSTNRETYPDGSLVHAPFPIPYDTVRHIWQVLGCVIMEQGGSAIHFR